MSGPLHTSGPLLSVATSHLLPVLPSADSCCVICWLRLIRLKKPSTVPLPAYPLLCLPLANARLYGNDLCFPFEDRIAQVCDSPTRLPLFSAPSFCPNTTCPSLYAPSPAIFAFNGSCVCASPIVAEVSLTASPFYVYNGRVANLFEANVAFGVGAAVDMNDSQVRTEGLCNV